MPVLVAVASLPFGLRGGQYDIKVQHRTLAAHVTEQRYSPAVTVASRPELAQTIPPHGTGEGWTTYTWYDHPFVLRATFGRNVASLGSINSWAMLSRPVAEGLDLQDEAAIGAVRDTFADLALQALNELVAIVRRKARLFQVFDLRRDDIEITVRRDDGTILCEDPLQEALTSAEQRETDKFDLVGKAQEWYQDLNAELLAENPVSQAEDLLMEAERALRQRFPRQAITTSHTTIETAASALLNHGMTRRRVPEDEIGHLLTTKSLNAKLDTLLNAYTGFSLKRDNHSLWKSFNLLNELRNDVVHRGKRPSVRDAELAIQCARDIVTWLEMVAQRNRSR